MNWAIVPAAFALGMIVLLVLAQSIYAIDTWGVLPNEGTREFLSVAGSIAVVTPFAWVALLIRRHEQARLETTTEPIS